MCQYELLRTLVLSSLLGVAISSIARADAAVERQIRGRMEAAIRILEDEKHELFIRDFLHREIILEYVRSSSLTEVLRRFNGKGWLRTLRLTQDEDIHFSKDGETATLSYNYDTWGVSTRFKRDGDGWYLTVVGNYSILLDRHFEGEDPRVARDDQRRTILHREALTGNLAEVKKWVHRQADVFAQDAEGNTPLVLAEKAGHKEVAAFLKRRMEKKKFE